MHEINYVISRESTELLQRNGRQLRLSRQSFLQVSIGISYAGVHHSAHRLSGEAFPHEYIMFTLQYWKEAMSGTFLGRS